MNNANKIEKRCNKMHKCKTCSRMQENAKNECRTCRKIQQMQEKSANENETYKTECNKYKG